MIQGIIVENYLGEKTEIKMNNPDETGFIIKNISGLGPQKADVHISEYAMMDGGLLSSSRLPSRNITIDLELIEKPTIEAVRLSSYRIFPIKKPLSITFLMDSGDYTIDGTVESNEPEIFSDKETIQISIRCENPHFYKMDLENKINIYKNEPLFSFPFSNPSLTENLIVFSEIKTVASGIVINDGMDDIGGYFTFRFTGPVKNLYFMNVTNGTMMSFKSDVIVELYGSDFKNGDLLEISTIQGRRSIILYREAKALNALNALDRSSKWIQFFRGINQISYGAESGAENVSLEIVLNREYEGI